MSWFLSAAGIDAAAVAAAVIVIAVAVAHKITSPEKCPRCHGVGADPTCAILEDGSYMYGCPHACQHCQGTGKA